MNKEDLINGYFEGTLSDNELKTLESLLENDAAFTEDFEFQKALKSALKKEDRKNIKAIFSDLNQKNIASKTKVFNIRPWLVAASIAILVGLGSWLLFFNSNTLDTDTLYATHFVPYENVVNPIQRGVEIENIKTKAFLAYENGEYEKALQLFEKANTHSEDHYITFYEAIILMQLNKHEKAINLLNEYITNDGKLADRATWYLALSYLKLGKIKPCKTTLKTLIELNSFKTNEALNLLNILD